MAQDQSAKRLNLATKCMNSCVTLVDVANDTNEERLEAAQAGNFVQTEFDGTALKHLTPTIIGALTANVFPDFQTWLDQTAYAGGPTRRQLLQQVIP